MTLCRICASPIHAFMSFGKMPIANGFLAAEEIPQEYYFELAPAICDKCHMFQIVEQPAPEKMFHESYAFYSSTSTSMDKHFAKFANDVIDNVLPEKKDSFVVELGSNDGIMLRNFQNSGIRHLGIEPSRNVADVARAQGVNTISEFFNNDLAEKLLVESGPADVILAANVMCHIPDLSSVAEGIRILLKPDGLLIFEDPYLGAMIEKTSYDQIYDEHVFMFSAMSVANAFGRHGLELIDLTPQQTHGGSMRYHLAPRGARRVSPTVGAWLERETTQGLDQATVYQGFKRNCEQSRLQLRGLLEDLRAQQKRIVGYGATSKSTTVMNYCGINSSHIEFISDTTPIKQGKLTPGTHIPVRPYQEFVSNYPDYAVLFAWNHAAEIRAREGNFIASGGKWILYVPEVQVAA
jgi:methylation protein EvaC